MSSKSAQKTEDFKARLALQMKDTNGPNQEVVRRATQTYPEISSPNAAQDQDDERPDQEETAARDTRPETDEDDDPETSPSSKSQARTKPKAATRKPSKGKAEKRSISLHPEDLEKIDELLDALKEKGHRRGINDSTVIKIALAAMNPRNPQLLQLLKDVQARDGRKKAEAIA